MDLNDESLRLISIYYTHIAHNLHHVHLLRIVFFLCLLFVVANKIGIHDYRLYFYNYQNTILFCGQSCLSLYCNPYNSHYELYHNIAGVGIEPTHFLVMSQAPSHSASQHQSCFYQLRHMELWSAVPSTPGFEPGTYWLSVLRAPCTATYYTGSLETVNPYEQGGAGLAVASRRRTGPSRDTT